MPEQLGVGKRRSEVLEIRGSRVSEDNEITLVCQQTRRFGSKLGRNQCEKNKEQCLWYEAKYQKEGIEGENTASVQESRLL